MPSLRPLAALHFGNPLSSDLHQVLAHLQIPCSADCALSFWICLGLREPDLDQASAREGDVRNLQVAELDLLEGPDGCQEEALPGTWDAIERLLGLSSSRRRTSGDLQENYLGGFLPKSHPPEKTLLAQPHPPLDLVGPGVASLHVLELELHKVGGPRLVLRPSIHGCDPLQELAIQRQDVLAIAELFGHPQDTSPPRVFRCSGSARKSFWSSVTATSQLIPAATSARPDSASKGSSP